ncbi:MAG TPA: AMP-binding protein [Solirubrobacteraceae bacterium]
MTNFAEQLQAGASEHPDHPAIKLDDLALNYQLLDGATARAADLLRSRGVEVGARAGMQLPNVPYFPVVYFGALRLGAVVVPMNPLLKEREIAYHLSDSGTSAARLAPVP